MGFITGILAGLFGGILGIGGGAIMIPLMVGLMKMGQHQAHGTSLAAMVFLAISGAVTYGMKGSVNITASAVLAATSVGTAYLGAHYAHALPAWKLRKSFGVFLLIVTVMLFLKPYVVPSAYGAMGWNAVILLLVTGVITGFLSGMMGVGGGAVMIPAMVIFVGLDQHTAQGSSLLTMVPTGIAGAWTHFHLGNVRTRLLGSLIAGVVIGTYLGGNIAHLMQEGTLRIVFGIFLLVTGIRNMFTARVGSSEHC